MEDDVFRLALLALGSCIIAAVLAHGIWVSRKNNRKKSETSSGKNRKQHFEPSGWQDNDWQHQADDGGQKADDEPEYNINFNQTDEPDERSLQKGEFDDLGLGAVRVVSATNKDSNVAGDASTNQKQASDTVAKNDDMPSLADFEPSEKINQPEPKPVSSGKVYASVVSQPKPEYVAKYGNSATRSTPVFGNGKTTESYTAPEPPPFLLKTDEKPVSAPPVVDVEALKKTAQQALTEPQDTKPVVVEMAQQETAAPSKNVSLAEQARNLVMGKKVDNSKKRREPKIAEDQMRIDFDDDEPQKVAPQKAEPKKNAPAAQTPQEVLVLNVKSPDDKLIQGAALLPMLLTLGFKFGDQDIFHRHVNASGKGPVLFSLANMFKPGNFNIDNLENFTTQGLSLFMILPIEGDPHQVFNMMHNAARKLADEFSAQVYDGRRALLTKQSLQQYIEKIREFERKRMVNR